MNMGILRKALMYSVVLALQIPALFSYEKSVDTVISCYKRAQERAPRELLSCVKYSVTRSQQSPAFPVTLLDNLYASDLAVLEALAHIAHRSGYTSNREYLLFPTLTGSGRSLYKSAEQQIRALL